MNPTTTSESFFLFLIPKATFHSKFSVANFFNNFLKRVQRCYIKKLLLSPDGIV